MAVSALLGLLTAWPAVDADSLYIPELWLRLQAGGSLGTWCLTPNPSLWPDLALWHGLQWVAPGILPGLKAYGLVSGLALIWLSARFLRALAPLGRWQSLGWCALGLGLGLALTPQGSFLTWLAPAHQGTPFLAALWLWCLVLERERGQKGIGSTAWAWSVLGLGLLLGSSKFFILAGLIPALALSLRSPHSRWLWAALPLAAALAWMQVFWVKDSGARIPVVRWDYVWSHLSAQLRGFAQVLPSLMRSEAGSLALAMAAGLAFWAQLAWSERGLWAWSLGAWSLATALGLGLCAVMGSASGRFLALGVWLPTLWLPYLAAQRWPEASRFILLATALAVLCWRTYLLPPIAQPQALAQAQWLKAQAGVRGWQLGWGDYWQARPLRLLAEPGVPVLPVAATGLGGRRSLGPYLMIVDRALFPDEMSRPDFVVLQGLDPAMVRDVWGPPNESIQGPGIEVWDYAGGRR